MTYRDQKGEDDVDTIVCGDRLALALLGSGQPTLALKMHTELYELAKRKFPPEHEVRVN